ncbi:MAG: hypothetical protein HUJ25_10090 [Crocinitomicaceae bacterium]|nr:hypothetical protein [Crocinitomicaceae bacterium]
MRRVKKYAAIVVLLSIFPITWIAGRNFVTEKGTDIYAYIPQESDIVIEVNNVNFIAEFAYQRIFNEAYVMENIDFEEVEIETGIDYFSKIVLFREQWADEYIWIAVIAYSDKDKFKTYVQTKLKDTHMAMSNGYAILQLSTSMHQEKMDERLVQIARKEIKPFTSRVDLRKFFKADKEINCYFIPPSADFENELIDGHLSFDFHQDHVDIGGEFTPVSGFEDVPTIAYALDEDVAFSLRSSLNVFNSIYWFSKEKIEGIPEYKQMALDYDGVNMFMVDGSFNYKFPFKKYPEMQLHFDMVNNKVWYDFIDTLVAQEKIRLDTTAHILATEEGTFFKYELNKEIFELYQSPVNLKENKDEGVCFAMQLQIEPLLDNTKFMEDEANPPGDLMKKVGMAVAKDMMDDLHALANVEQINFQLTKESNSKIKASGKVQMKNREGQSVIESLLFARESFYFISLAIDVATDS